jgi:branched-chain amino acid transport system permease protein
VTEYLIAIATIVGIQILLTLGLTLHYGITGLVNFGHVAFYALGAYASALLTLAGAPFVVAMLVGVALAVAASLLVGTATLRLREDYFAILTLGFSELLRLLLLNARELTRGALGIPGIPRPWRALPGVPDHVAYLLSCSSPSPSPSSSARSSPAVRSAARCARSGTTTRRPWPSARTSCASG